MEAHGAQIPPIPTSRDAIEATFREIERLMAQARRNLDALESRTA